MQRKQFLHACMPLLFANKLLGHSTNNFIRPSITIPPYLKAGDTIAITSPAGFVTEKEIEAGVAKIKELGFNVLVGTSIGKKHFSFGGTDEERLTDFQSLLDNNTVKAIFCARGGYGFVRIIDQLNFSTFKNNPKWIIGFSDITVLHSHVHKQLQIATVHGKMCSQFPEVWNEADAEQQATLMSVFNCITGTAHTYTAPFNSNNKLGNITSIVVGGNLKTIESLSGSKSDIDTKGKILFVEDVGEALYSIDRMFYNLQRSGKLNRLAGLMVGGFKFRDENPNNSFGETVYDIVAKHTQTFNYPIAFDFPVGHQKNNYALICGGTYSLQITNEGTTLQYIV
jgi:muramoyltetrapeptide carboxypeptidase